MVIKIFPKFTADEIKKMLQDRLMKIDKAVLTSLQFIGEAFVKNAREKGTYQDRTGNLRNSIGYLIMRDGVILYENFRRSARVETKVAKGKNKGNTKVTAGSKDGVLTGKSLAYDSSRKYPQGYALIVVAGMDYAAAVESKGKDVLTGSSITAKAELRRAIKGIAAKIPKIR